MSKYIPENIRREVAERAGFVCEYCHLPQVNPAAKHHIEHIRPRKHGGETVIANLALACPMCNYYKGTDVVGFDLETDETVVLFNPRTEIWTKHFLLDDDGTIASLTAVARVTSRILRFNDLNRIEERRELIEVGLY